MFSTSNISIVGYFLSLILLLLIPSPSQSQPLEELKAGVVKITATVDKQHRRIGTGFIVKIEDETAYIVTASHVVEGDPQVQVAFYSDPNEPFTAKTIGLEGGDPKGLAVLRIKGTLPSGLRALSLDAKTTVRGGERVTLIGFPRIVGTPWAVTSGTVAGQKGRNLTFSGAADEGNSGGPLLIDGKVVGVVTEMISQFGYATPAVTMQFALKGWGVKLGEVLETQALAGEEQPALVEEARLQPTDPSKRLPTEVTVKEDQLLLSERKAIQASLKVLNYDSDPATGIFGDKTRRGIREFQQRVDANPTGRLGDSEVNLLHKKATDSILAKIQETYRSQEVVHDGKRWTPKDFGGKWTAEDVKTCYLVTKGTVLIGLYYGLVSGLATGKHQGLTYPYFENIEPGNPKRLGPKELLHGLNASEILSHMPNVLGYIKDISLLDKEMLAQTVREFLNYYGKFLLFLGQLESADKTRLRNELEDFAFSNEYSPNDSFYKLGFPEHTNPCFRASEHVRGDVGRNGLYLKINGQSTDYSQPYLDFYFYSFWNRRMHDGTMETMYKYFKFADKVLAN